MRRLSRLAGTVGLLLALAPAAGAAQDGYIGSVGYGAGGIWFSPFNGSSEGPALELSPGWIVTAHVDQFLDNGWLGGRVSGGFSQRPLDGLPQERDISLWMADAALLLRPLAPGPGRRVLPFLSAGLGVVNYDLGRGVPVVLDDPETVYLGDRERQLAGTVGVGADLFPRLMLAGDELGLRLELTDRVAFESPFSRTGGDAYGPVHNVVLSLELQGLRW